MATAQDIMIRDVISVRPDISVKDMLLLFADRKVSGVPVLENRIRLVGMVTIGDLLRNLEEHLPHTVDVFTFVSFYTERAALPDRVREIIGEPVRSIMTTRRLVTVSPATDIDEIIDIFARDRFKKLPVVNGQKEVVGVISRGDLIRHIVRDMLL